MMQNNIEIQRGCNMAKIGKSIRVEKKSLIILKNIEVRDLMKNSRIL